MSNRTTGRGLAVSPSRWFAADDAQFLLAWPFCRYLAARVAEDQWPLWIMQYAENWGLLRSSGVNALTARISRALDIDAAAARDIARSLAVGKLEHLVQIARANSPSRWTPPVVIEGAAFLDNALEGKRGGVLWVAHFNFSSLVTKMALHAHGYQASHLSRPEHGFSKSAFGLKWLNPIRQRVEDRFISKRIVIDRTNPGGAMLKATKVLRQNGLVSITAGAWEGIALRHGKIFGGNFKLATGAPALALLTGAPLHPVVTVRDGAGYRVYIAESISLREQRGRDDALQVAVERFFHTTEPFVRQYPEQWSSWKYLQFKEDGTR